MRKERFEKVVDWEGKPWFIFEIVALITAMTIMVIYDKTSPFFWFAFFLALLAVLGMEGNLKSRKETYWRKIK